MRSTICGALLVAAAACRTVPARPAASAAPAASAVSSLARDVDTILADPALERSTWGVVVRSSKSGETLYSVNARKLLMPASNMKIVTLAAAAERLGWDFTFTTTLAIHASIRSGTLEGDLVVSGTGDPSLMAGDGSGDRVFAGWAERLKARGIRVVAGRIIGDDRWFTDQALGFGWSWDDLPEDYAAGTGALQFNENAARVTVGPGPRVGDAAAIEVDPPGSGLVVVSSVSTIAAGGTRSISTHRLPGTTRLALRGTIPVDAAPSPLVVSVDNPTLFFLSRLKAALIANGIDVRGEIVDIDDLPPFVPEPALLIDSYRSPPLSALAGRLMKASQNQYAETLLKTLGRATGTPTAAGGRAAVLTTLEAWNIHGDAVIQRDGSGLSRYDYVTPEAIVAVLTHVERDDRLRGPFAASLPIAGRDGTLANRLKGTPAEGNVQAKTGSMSNVRALSGYLTTTAGEPLVFAILANNFEVGADVINRATDAIVLRLTRFSR